MLNHVVISYRQPQPSKTQDTRWNYFSLLPGPIPCRLTLFGSRIPMELRGFSQACIFNRVQAFLRIYKNSLCLTCTKLKCNALLKQDSKIKISAKHYLQPKILQFRLKLEESVAHLQASSSLRIKTFLEMILYFLCSSRPQHETNASYKARSGHKIKRAIK